MSVYEPRDLLSKAERDYYLFSGIGFGFIGAVVFLLGVFSYLE